MHEPFAVHVLLNSSKESRQYTGEFSCLPRLGKDYPSRGPLPWAGTLPPELPPDRQQSSFICRPTRGVAAPAAAVSSSVKSSGACRRWCTPASAVEPRPIGGPGVRHGALVGLTHLGGVFGEKPRLVAGRQRPPGGRRFPHRRGTGPCADLPRRCARC